MHTAKIAGRHATHTGAYNQRTQSTMQDIHTVMCECIHTGRAYIQPCSHTLRHTTRDTQSHAYMHTSKKTHGYIITYTDTCIHSCILKPVHINTYIHIYIHTCTLAR